MEAEQEVLKEDQNAEAFETAENKSKSNASSQSSPRKVGPFAIPEEAKTKADVGVFLVGASAGGIADAVINFAGFAEPLLVSGLCGAGALGIKKTIEAWREDIRKK